MRKVYEAVTVSGAIGKRFGFNISPTRYLKYDNQ